MKSFVSHVAKKFGSHRAKPRGEAERREVETRMAWFIERTSFVRKLKWEWMSGFIPLLLLILQVDICTNSLDIGRLMASPISQIKTSRNIEWTT